MAQQRTKLQVSVGAQDTATDNVNVAASATVTLLLVGATINQSDTIEAADLTVDVYHPGQLAVGHIVTVWNKTTDVMGASTMDIASIVDNGGDWTITFNGITGDDVAVSDGDRLTCTPIGAHRVGKYEQEIGGFANTSPIALDSSGQGHAWISSSNSDVDIYISGTGLTSRWFLDQRVGDVGVTWDYTDDETIMHNDLDLDGNDIKGVGAIAMTGALGSATTVTATTLIAGSELQAPTATISETAALDCSVVLDQSIHASAATITILSSVPFIKITGTADIAKIDTCVEGRVLWVWFSDPSPGDILHSTAAPNPNAGEFMTVGGIDLSPVTYQLYQFVGITIGANAVWIPIEGR